MGIRAAVSALVLLALVACGGGSSSSAEGIWSGSYTIDSTAGPTPLHAIIQDGAQGIFYDYAGLSFVAANFSGTDVNTGGTLYPPYGFIFTGSTPTLPVTIRVTVSNGAMIGTATLEGGQAPLTLTPIDPTSSTPSVMAGVWSGTYIGSSNVAFQVATDGTIDGNDAFGCHLSGSIKLLDASKDLFSVSITTSGGSVVCGHQFKGLAYESDKDELGIDGHATGTYYYLAAYDSAAAFLTELKVQ